MCTVHMHTPPLRPPHQVCLRPHMHAPPPPSRFAYDHVYDQHSLQEEVYRNSAQQVVLSILQVGRGGGWVVRGRVGGKGAGQRLGRG